MKKLSAERKATMRQIELFCCCNCGRHHTIGDDYHSYITLFWLPLLELVMVSHIFDGASAVIWDETVEIDGNYIFTG